MAADKDFLLSGGHSDYLAFGFRTLTKSALMVYDDLSGIARRQASDNSFTL